MTKSMPHHVHVDAILHDLFLSLSLLSLSLAVEWITLSVAKFCCEPFSQPYACFYCKLRLHTHRIQIKASQNVFVISSTHLGWFW